MNDFPEHFFEVLDSAVRDFNIDLPAVFLVMRPDNVLLLFEIVDQLGELLLRDSHFVRKLRHRYRAVTVRTECVQRRESMRVHPVLIRVHQMPPHQRIIIHHKIKKFPRNR